VHELARELGLSAKAVLSALVGLGVHVKSASSTVEAAVAAELRRTLGQPPATFLTGSPPLRHSTWRAGAVRPSAHPDTIINIDRLKRAFPVAAEHQDSLVALGSQFLHTTPCKISGFEECYVALVRFSGAIESAFGLTREVLFFYSPYRDLQIRTFRVAKQVLASQPREVTPDIIFFSAPDVRLREKLDDWSSGSLLAIPLELPVNDDALTFISTLRDYIFSRDLFYETTPVRGERFFGRRRLLQSLRDDVQNQRVTGLFGLRKSGKTSVLSELARNLSGPTTMVVLRDLESLPSPPADPVPDLLRELVGDLLAELRSRHLRIEELASVSTELNLSSFKTGFQAILRELDQSDVTVVLLLDEIEYLTPSDRIDIIEGDLTSVAQLLGVLRSLVQENANFTFLLSGLTSAIIENGRLYGRPNPLFSWAKANFLSPFERHEADDLALSVGQKMGITIEKGALEALFEASGGHAFLYRHLASRVVSELPIDVFQRNIRRSDVLRALPDWRLVVAGNMKEMLDHVKRYYPDEAYLLEVLRFEPESFDTIADDAPLALGHLINLGLVERTGHEYELTPVLQML
jgi:hypothetical protein